MNRPPDSDFTKVFCTDDHKDVVLANDGVCSTLFERSDRLTKSASDVVSRNVLQDLMPPDGCFGVHATSMGAEEFFGYNRNGDSSSERALELYHPTFEKYGHVYREHRNRDPKTQGVGQIKLAVYNPRMHRGELVMWIEKDNAPDLYKRAAAGDEISWSMSMRLPYDRCSICDNKSKRPSSYCWHLKKHLSRYIKELRKSAYARNEDDVKFFDMSEVERRADRIASYLGYTFRDNELELGKAAADDLVIGGGEWAKFAGYDTDPLYGLVDFNPWEMMMLVKLAAAERELRHASPEVLAALHASLPNTLALDVCEKAAHTDFPAFAGALAKRAMILDFPSFAQILTGQSVGDLRSNSGFGQVEERVLPHIFSNMLAAGGACCGDCAGMVAPDEHAYGIQGAGDKVDEIMRRIGGDLDFSSPGLQSRAMNSPCFKSASLRETPSVAVALDPFYVAMAEAYGAYAVKAARMAAGARDVSEHMLSTLLAATNCFSR